MKPHTVVTDRVFPLRLHAIGEIETTVFFSTDCTLRNFCSSYVFHSCFSFLVLLPFVVDRPIGRACSAGQNPGTCFCSDGQILFCSRHTPTKIRGPCYLFPKPLRYFGVLLFVYSVLCLSLRRLFGSHGTRWKGSFLLFHGFLLSAHSWWASGTQGYSCGLDK